MTGDIFQYPKWDTSFKGMTVAARSLLRKYTRSDQVYNVRRVEILGPDLAAAHFFTKRGGIVKFIGENMVFDKTLYKSLPTSRDPSFHLEAISLPNFDLYYEGLENLRNLHHLKAISFRGVEQFNNWYLDRLSCLVPTLEYLDISYCNRVDFNGLHCLYRLRNLKCLNVEGVSDSLPFRVNCLTLESEKPDLVVVGLITRPKVKSAFDDE
ncbi:uncharacterized protein LOC135834505 [Planococcus citri]|uniref:uncharacterized protein LOC135834505 n=1 Tax=Planococcus citri TaxID=170843 RepID=UPI0031F7C4AA